MQPQLQREERVQVQQSAMLGLLHKVPDYSGSHSETLIEIILILENLWSITGIAGRQRMTSSIPGGREHVASDVPGATNISHLHNVH